jgi:hypothetical protein|nr:MAG TPA: PemK-like protein [Caudoviricetes sp.]
MDGLQIGDVHYVSMDESNGITPKDGYATRNKFFIILGFDGRGNAVGGVVINSRVNSRMGYLFTDYLMPISTEQCPCLAHNSFVNCTKIKSIEVIKLNQDTYQCSLEDELVQTIKRTLIESPTTNHARNREFGLE